MDIDGLDADGQEEYSVMRDMYIRTGYGFLLVFDVSRIQTFDELESFYQKIS